MGQKIMDKKKQSAKQIILQSHYWYIVLLAFLALFVTVYSVRTYKKEIDTQQQSVLRFYAESLEADLMDIQTYLTTTLTNSSYFNNLQIHLKPTSVLNAAYYLEESFQMQLAVDNTLTGLWCYSDLNDLLRYKISDAKATDAERMALISYMNAYVRQSTVEGLSEWKTLQIGERNFLVYLRMSNGCRVAAVVSISDLPQPILGKEVEAANSFYYDTKMEMAVSAKHMVGATENSDIDMRRKGADAIFADRVLVQPVRGTSLQLWLVRNAGMVLGGTFHMLVLFLLVIVLCIAAEIFIQRILKQHIIHPLDELQHRILRMNPDAEAEEQNSWLGADMNEEFALIHQSFDSMLQRNRELRIEKYEAEIARKNAQMQYLQQQLEPHFYLNCLKTIHGMAQMHKYEKIQKLSIDVSKHFRYVFRDDFILVPLEDELQFVKNYLEIVNMEAEQPVQCMISMEPALLDWSVPPLCVQTFVENSIKYARREERALIIEITIHGLVGEDGDLLDIIIDDNGNGYPEGYLRGEMKSATHGIGIKNLTQRLRLIYGDRAACVCMNLPTGARAEVLLPRRKELDDEYSACR